MTIMNMQQNSTAMLQTKARGRERRYTSCATIYALFLMAMEQPTKVE
jgi:hypothetical protein